MLIRINHLSHWHIRRRRLLPYFPYALHIQGELEKTTFSGFGKPLEVEYLHILYKDKPNLLQVFCDISKTAARLIGGRFEKCLL